MHSQKPKLSRFSLHHSHGVFHYKRFHSSSPPMESVVRTQDILWSGYKKPFRLVPPWKLCGAGTGRRRRANMAQTNQQTPSGLVERAKEITVEIIISLEPKQSNPGKSVFVQIGSSSKIEDGKGKLSKAACLEKGWSKRKKDEKIINYTLKFLLEPDFGIPGALLIANKHQHRFFLQSAVLHVPNKQNEDFPKEYGEDPPPKHLSAEAPPLKHEHIHFDCRSWVYPVSKTKTDYRVFFSNACYLPSKTPIGLVKWRKEELDSLRGEGKSEELKEWDRVYDYDYYNDLGNPDKRKEYSRPVLGGPQCPYPRRTRTGPHREKDPRSGSRPDKISLDVYVPHDERLSPKRLIELKSNVAKATALILRPTSPTSSSNDSSSFVSFESIRDEIFLKSDKNLAVPKWVKKELKKILSRELYKDITGKSPKLKLKKYLTIHRITKAKPNKRFLTPQIIAVEDESAWSYDEEFARQMLAGANPVRIQRLQEFPPKSRNGVCSQIEKSDLDVYPWDTVDEAVKKEKIFILEHHDYLMPFLSRINAKDHVHAYASRTLLVLDGDNVLVPKAIELSLPGTRDGQHSSQVFIPDEDGWELAKSHVAANDSAYHQLVSHWLHTHAVVEPFIIATRRQLSLMHPVHRLLDPHFKDTIHMNALARTVLLNSGGILEKILFTGEFSMKLSSELYKEWRFDKQALPDDLVKRGMAEAKAKAKPEVKEESSESPELVLCLEDYPYAVDGLEIWDAIENWVADFCDVYYKDDASVQYDEEIQAWWKEIRYVGHGDKCEETWWYPMTTCSNLQMTLTTLIWIASALHAAVNFGQYSYAGYPPNRPTLCRKPIPNFNSTLDNEHRGNEDDRKRYHLETLPQKFEMTLSIALMEVLSRHSSEEVFLGNRSSINWTDNKEVQGNFEKFNKKLKEIERNILARNKNFTLEHRCGAAHINYKLLYPDTSNEEPKGYITGKGIPNSISI